MQTVKEILYEMLVEDTGCALCDSGDHYGRHWQQNQNRTLADFENAPDVTWETDSDGKLYPCGYTISVFHYLSRQLDVDEICERFNKINLAADNWDDDRFYGVSAKAGRLLDKLGCDVGRGFNSYNDPDHLSQTIQGQHITINGRYYLILQIHGGCDVRGGYTTARLFVLDNDYCYDGGYLCPQDVFGAFTPNGADSEAPTSPGTIYFDNCYDGEILVYDQDSSDHGQPISLNENDGKIEMRLAVS